MADPNLVDFYDRVSRFERMRQAGYGFDAQGTLGRSYFRAAPARRNRLLAPALITLVAFFALKGVIHYAVGEAAYQMRVDKLLAAEGVDYAGGWLMQADPVTLWISDLIAQGMTQLL